MKHIFGDQIQHNMIDSNVKKSLFFKHQHFLADIKNIGSCKRGTKLFK